MSIYIKQFDPAANSAFSKIRTRSKDGATVAVGNVGNAACMVSVDLDGNIITQLEYIFEDAAINFNSIIEVAEGYLAFGTRKINEDRNQALIVRLDTKGAVLWSRIYRNATTGRPIGLVPVSQGGQKNAFPELFLFANRNSTIPGKDNIELVKINLQGTVLASKMLYLQIDRTSAVNLTLFGSGAAIYGGTNEINGHQGFILGFDFNLNLNYRKLLGGAIAQEILSIVNIGNQYVAAGVAQATNPARGSGKRMSEILSYSFLFKFDTASTNAVAKGYDLQPEFDAGVRTLINDSDKTPNHYLFAAQDTGSVAAKFDYQFNLLWTKRLDFPGSHFIADAIFSAPENEMILCGWVNKNAQKCPVVYRTDKEYTTCLTLENTKPTPITINFELMNWAVEESVYQPVVTDVALLTKTEPIPNRFVCPINTINTGGLIQSPYLYLQAVGSDETDASSKGIHLRWRFQKSLGDQHLAKGIYANPSSPYHTAIGFNKSNDFIKIFRAPYGEKFQTRVQIRDTVLPTQEIKAGNIRTWRFNNIALSFGSGTTNVHIRFNDIAQYDAIRASMTTLKPESFMKQYTGIIEIEPVSKLFFAAQIMVSYNQGPLAQAFLRAEAISYDDPTNAASVFVACRKKFQGPSQLSSAKIIGESLKYIRLDYSIAYISEIVLETYFDFILNTKNAVFGYTWEFINDFALTLDTAEAFDRLENKNNPFVPNNKKYTVDKQWNKYNDANASTGASKIRIDNYRHRWYPAPNSEHPDTQAVDGIQKAIQDYLTLSTNDLKATASLPVQNDPGNLAKLDISYFDIMRFVSLDFHVARMMGLGHIDADILNDSTPYIYLMAYTSRGPLEAGNPAGLLRDHLYMSLPTTLKDYRLPPVPVQLPVTYGIANDNGFGVMNPLTDVQGYVPFDTVRFVNINRDPYPHEKPFGAFFADQTEFCLSNETIPIKYGLEYKEQSESQYRKPEITQDDEYFDHAGFNEVVEIPEQGKNPLYLHQEKEEGVHCYGIYTINWFCRVSQVSNNTCTDYTLFKKIKSLLPPSNFAVQLIQPEDSLLLTTAKEQTTLATLSGPDKTMLRATFEWNHNHNVNYPFAERAQFFYRDAPADSIRGEVASVTQLPNNKVLVEVKSFQILSTNPIETIEPVIPPGQEQKYIGSLFSCGEQGYVIDSINNASLPYAKFTLSQIKQTDSSAPLNNNQIVTVIDWLKPNVGDWFLVAENLAVETNWSTRLQRSVYLEKFHTNHLIRLENTGTGNNGIYRLEQVIKNGANTELVLLDKLKSNTVTGNIRYERVFRLLSLDPIAKKLAIKGNVAGEFTGGSSVRLFGSSYPNDKDYVVAGNSAYSPIANLTAITLSGTIPDTNANFGYVAIEKTAPIVALNRKTKTVTVQGILTPVIIPPYIETRVEYDHTVTKLSYGGIYQAADVQEYPIEIIDPDNPQITTLQHIGAYTIKFNNNYALLPHIDPSVEWHKGIVRIFDKNQNEKKSLQVWEIVKDSTGKIMTPLELIVFDPDFKKIEIQSNNAMVNFHPSYRLYLGAEYNASNANDATHQFNAATIMPDVGEGSKMTYMGIRSIDRFKQPPSNNIVQYDSYIAPLVPVLAREIIHPAIIEITGPKFATRPDFYKKSTYTIDLKLDTSNGRKPYSVLAYRGSETKVLDTLYSDATLKTLIPDIEKLKKNDPNAYYTMLFHLVNVNVFPDDGNVYPAPAGNFILIPNQFDFSFPLPDNTDYIIPDRDPEKKERPFLTPKPITKIPPSSGEPSQYENVRQAILDSFLSLTEQPVVYKYVKGGLTTSGRKPIFRNNNGDLITPVLPETIGYNPDLYDPHPMAVKFAKKFENNKYSILLPSDSVYNDPNNEFYIRFTDYTLDGASQELYFYYACEITNQLVIGPVDRIIAPVLMVNTAPAEAPGIRAVQIILANPVENVRTSVLFQLNKYNDSEGIAQFWVYRAYNSADASNIRSMELVKKIDADQVVIDDFSDLPIPPYGETLFYKIVAIRKIKNELSQDEYILSLPSKLVQPNIVDVLNPKAPKLFAENGITTPIVLQNVILKWKPTAYNGTYYLQKLNNNGNWDELYRTRVKDADMQYPPLGTGNLPDFTNFPETKDLPRIDINGHPIYHRFRVQVENASGLFNLSEFELTLAKGASDLQEIDSVLSYSDAHDHQLPVLKSSDFVSGASQPDQMVFTHLNGPLPAGHNAFVAIEITVSEDLGHTFTRTINTPGGNAVFNHGDGGLNFDAAFPNRIYTIRTKLFTDAAPAGAVQVYTLNYLVGTRIALHPDFAALMDLYNSTNGPNWMNNTGWQDGAAGNDYNPCNWFGVTCNENGRVKYLNLNSNNLSGALPASIDNLTFLESLDLYNNQLSGAIPGTLGNITSLTNIRLDSNALTGSIPSSLSGLANLQYLYLNGNQLSGPIPLSLGNLSNLLVMYLSTNQLSGSIPASFGGLTNCFTLAIADNQLSGNIPSQISAMTNLGALWLGGNQLISPIPDLSGLTNLTSLQLDQNQFDGPIPTWLGSMIGLKILILDRNQFSGPIPGELGNLTNLTALYLFSNQLSGLYHPNLANLCPIGANFLLLSGNPGLPDGGSAAGWTAFCTGSG